MQAKCKQKQICIFFPLLFHLPVFWKFYTPQFYRVNMWHMPQVAYSHWGLYATRKESSLTMRFLDEFTWLIIIKAISFFYAQIAHTWAELSRVEPTDSVELSLLKVLDKYLNWCVHTKLKINSPGNSLVQETRGMSWQDIVMPSLYTFQKYTFLCIYIMQ